MAQPVYQQVRNTASRASSFALTREHLRMQDMCHLFEKIGRFPASLYIARGILRVEMKRRGFTRFDMTVIEVG